MLMMQEIDTMYETIIILFPKGFIFKSLFVFSNSITAYTL